MDCRARREARGDVGFPRHGAGDGLDQDALRRSLQHEGRSAGAERLGGQLRAAGSGEDHDAGRGERLAHAGHRTYHIALHGEVHDDHVGPVALGAPENVVHTTAGRDDAERSRLFENRHDPFDNDRMVVHDRNRNCAYVTHPRTETRRDASL